MTNSVKGKLNSYCDYRHIQKDDSTIINEAGKIDYELTLGSGTGDGQINEVWYKNKTLGASDSIDLLNIPFTRFGYNFNASFMGAGSANLKAIHVENSSSYDIGVRLPFDRFNAGYSIVPPSGNILISNIRGWPVSPTGSVIQISGNNTNQNYSISLMGAALPIFIDRGIGINVEWKASGKFDKIINIENMKASVSSAGSIPIEFLHTPSGSATGVIPIEYLKIASGTGDVPIEYTSMVEFGKVLPIEWKSSGIGGEASGELLRNTHFLYNGTGEDFSYFNGIPDPSSYPPWQFIWPTGQVVQDSNLSMVELKVGHFFAIWRFVPSGDEFVENYLLLGAPFSRLHRYNFSAKQEVYNVQSGVTYTLKWEHEVAYDRPSRPNSTDWPYYQLRAKNGTVLATQHFEYTYPPHQFFSTNITAIDDGFVLEWFMPRMPYYNTLSSVIPYQSYMSSVDPSDWFIERPSIKRT